MRCLKWAPLVGVLVGLGVAGPAYAGTLDQSQEIAGGPGGRIQINSGSTAAQVFTAGLTGGLDQVDLLVNKLPDGGCGTTPDLTVEIRTVEEGLPTATVLATTTISRAAIPEAEAEPGPPPASMTSAFFSSPVAVVAGTQYAIVARSDIADSCDYSWHSTGTNPYSGGTNAFSEDGTTFEAFADYDHAFRTYVQQPAAPPPPTVDCQGTAVPSTTGSEGDDDLVGTINADAIFGLGGNDELDGVDGDDCLDAGEGDDRASGGADDDLVKGGDGRDKVRGLGGKDRLKGQGGADRLNGGEGRDKLSGGRGADKLRGGAAKDAYKGNAGDDKLNAVDAKRDRVNCGAGEDKAVVDPVDRVSANCEDVREVERD